MPPLYMVIYCIHNKYYALQLALHFTLTFNTHIKTTYGTHIKQNTKLIHANTINTYMSTRKINRQQATAPSINTFEAPLTEAQRLNPEQLNQLLYR